MSWPRPTPPPDVPVTPEELIFKRHLNGLHVETPWWPVILLSGELLRQELGGTIRRTEREPKKLRIKVANGLAFYAVDSCKDDIYRCHLLYGE